jgi:hypothetical protein
MPHTLQSFFEYPWLRRYLLWLVTDDSTGLYCISTTRHIQFIYNSLHIPDFDKFYIGYFKTGCHKLCLGIYTCDFEFNLCLQRN